MFIELVRLKHGDSDLDELIRILFQKLGFQTSEKEQELIKYCKLL